MALTLAYDNKTNYQDVFQQVRMWDAICYNHLLRKGIQIPPNIHKSKDKAYEGAYVKDPQIGQFRWVTSFDLNSLYPHLIMQYNLSPECLIQPDQYTHQMEELITKYSRDILGLIAKKPDLSFLKDHNITFTPNGQFFRTDIQGFLPEIMQKMYDDRVVYKKKMIEAEKSKELETNPEKKREWDDVISRYKNLQLAKKVGLNSAYGAMGNEFFRFFDTRIAEAVTLSGQLSIRWIETRLNEYMNKLLKTVDVDYVIASDTDSIYLNMEALIKKLYPTLPETSKVINTMDKICNEKLQPFIDSQYKDLAEYVHAYAQKMSMKRESLVDRAIWTAKKRYILNVYDQEGVRYAEPKLKIQGLEAVKSSTPMACRDRIKEAIKLILKTDESTVQNYINEFRVEFKKLPVEDISFPRSVNGLTQYGKESNKKSSSMDFYYEEDEGKISLEQSESGVPIHTRGALLYNSLLESMKLTGKYPLIQEGEKIKFVYLKKPNKYHSHVIGFSVNAPKEFELEKCVDYNTQFDKSFVEPLKIILTSIGWKTEKESTLEDFFS